MIFRYGQAEIEHLGKRDRKLGAAIERLGPIERTVTPDTFTALVKSIASQQVSSKAAATVWSRLLDTLGEITPESVATADIERIQGCGLSMRKAGYIRGVGEAVASGMIDTKAFESMPDAAIIEQLSALRGVGVWTAEMLLIFSLGRPDVLSWSDLAIRRGMMRLYGLEAIRKEQFERCRRRYSPYGSVASLYLWAIAVM